MSATEHERLNADLSAYALDALTAEEARAVEAHLADCEQCRAELRWLEPAVDVLAEAVPQVSPPERLREKLIETARGESRGAERTGWRRVWPSWATKPVTALAATALLAAGIAGYALRGGNGEEAVTTAMPQMALDRQGDSGTLRVSNLPEPGEGVYQVWIQHGDEVSASSAFVTGADGSGETRIPSDLAGADAVMVTHEPERGREHPSGEPVVQTELD
jgi:anti-sigma-K factor RskA